MGNEGFLELTLLGVDSEPAHDPATFVEFLRVPGSVQIGSAKRAFPPARLFKLPAFPQEKAIACLITPERHRHREVGVFMLTHNETIRRQPTVFKVPQKWEADFVEWAELPDAFTKLQDVLEESDDLRVRKGKVFKKFVEDEYDGVDSGDRVTINAKACLLNLFSKLNTLKEPVNKKKSWFGFVDQVLEIDRERFIGLVQAEMLDRVKQISKDIAEFPEYKRTPAENHAKNVPTGYKFSKKDMVSIKTREDHGNIQLTLTPAVDPSGTSVIVLDSDIDENGKLMAHLGDLFKHRVTGGTHPFDIHEYLILEDKARPLGYTLI
jgi:hypothetical protein